MNRDYMLAVAGLVNMGQRPCNPRALNNAPSAFSDPSLPPSQHAQFHMLKLHQQSYGAEYAVCNAVMTARTDHYTEQDFSSGTSSECSLASSDSLPRLPHTMAPPMACSSDAMRYGNSRNKQQRSPMSHENQSKKRRGGFQGKFPSPKLSSGTGFPVKPGLYEQKVGLLRGLRTDAMDRYLGPEAGGLKVPRAPRQDLSKLSAEEKDDRRRLQAREHSRRTREQQVHVRKELEKEVEEMRIFQTVMDCTPQAVAVLSANVHSIILYANPTLCDLMSLSLERLQGGPFLDLLHPEDRCVLTTLLQTTVLQAVAPEKATVRCRLLCKGGQVPNVYRSLEITVAYGTSGIICSGWGDV